MAGPRAHALSVMHHATRDGSLPGTGPGGTSPGEPHHTASSALEFRLDGSLTGHRGSVTVQVPGMPREWAFLAAVQGGRSRNDGLRALPFGLASTWCWRGFATAVVVSRSPESGLAVFSFSDSGKQFSSKGTPQGACNELVARITGGGKIKVTGWVPIGCQQGSPLSIHLLDAADRPQTFETENSATFSLSVAVAPELRQPVGATPDVQQPAVLPVAAVSPDVARRLDPPCQQPREDVQQISVLQQQLQGAFESFRCCRLALAERRKEGGFESFRCRVLALAESKKKGAFESFSCCGLALAQRRK